LITYGIDPGTYDSALVGVDENFKVITKLYDSNKTIEEFLSLNSNPQDPLVIEFIQSYGLAVGQTTFLTCRAIGRFEKSWGHDKNTFLYARPTILSHITGGVRGKGKTQIIAALKLRFGEAKKGYPLEGIKKHLWDALAAAVYHQDGATLGAVDWGKIN
jgi:hypothetical protein